MTDQTNQPRPNGGNGAGAPPGAGGAAAPAAGATTSGAGPGGPGVGAPPMIVVRGGSLADNRYDAEAALALHTICEPLHGVYQRGGVLVRLHRIVTVKETDQFGVSRYEGTPQIVTMESGALRVMLAHAAIWSKFDARSRRPHVVDPPQHLLQPILDGPWSAIRPLSGVLETPAMMPDGRILQGQGYDEQTGYLLDTIPIEPITPSRREAESALKVLLDVFAGFPFVTEVDRSVALAGPLSALEALMVPATPMIAVDAPTAGSGKSLVCEAVALIATGRLPAAMPQAESAEEDKKRLLAILLSGDPLIMIDNAAKALEGDALCAILSGPGEYEDRLLGQTRKLRLPTRLLVLANGNNLRIVGDLIRRTLISRIDPKCENPDQRPFAVDLHEFIPKHRAEIVKASLTIMQSYVGAGWPKPLSPLASFSAWSRLVREPLVWLGMPDPVDSRQSMVAADPELEIFSAVMECWWACFKNNKTTARQAVDDAFLKTEDKYRAMRDAISNALVGSLNLGDHGRMAIGLGNYLRRKKDVVYTQKAVHSSRSRFG
jgi:hypothetical protein